MKETPFKEKVIEFLKERDIWYVKYWAGSQYTKEGVPDIIACINGRLHGIELKTDAGSESKLQAYNLDKINQNFGSGYVLRPTEIRPQKYPEFKYDRLTFDDWVWLYFGDNHAI